MAFPNPPCTRRQLSAGHFYPLGATPLRGGINFALYSEHAAAVVLELYDDPTGPPTDVIPLTHRTRYVWHVFVHGIGPGQLYAYRVDGRNDPRAGLRFNPHKLLLDPYARALTGRVINRDNLLLPHQALHPDRDLTVDLRDDAAIMPKGIVAHDDFEWEDDEQPDIPLDDLLIYEVHLRGFTRHPSSSVRQPGTYLGFIEKIPYLKQLGINAVELLPVHAFYVEDFLVDRGLTNYWGYNTVSFFAPETSYGSGSSPACEIREFKTLVKELHRAGIEVILDVVYNHTGEGNEVGPMFSFKGIDNPTYYLLRGDDDEPRRYYVNHSGCGNSLNLGHPAVIRLVMDSLRYWVEAMHVDGFRFDLASVLGRGPQGFERAASFFGAVSQDPVLSRIKLIAEPWDVGTYQVGNFPVDWSEWNGHFRDTCRRFWKGDPGQVSELGWRLTGSADLYGDDGRSPYNSVNFVTCHDGYTLRDLVCYEEKHNEANGEENRDGANDNHAWNCGVEGPCADPAVERLRQQQAKNMACMLLFSSGTPMIMAGDELLRTQQGNNNAYCQDNELSWLDWSLLETNRSFFEFFRKAIAMARRYPILHRRKFYCGSDSNGNGHPDIRWYGPNLDQPAWHDSSLRTIAYMLDGSEEPSWLGDHFLFFIFHAGEDNLYFNLPVLPPGLHWWRVVDTSLPPGEEIMEPGREVLLQPEDHYWVNGRSTVVMLGR